MTRPRIPLAFILAFGFVVILDPVSLAQAPRFVEGDLDKLTCKVIKRVKAPFADFLVIEVNNRGAHPCEPLSFELEFRPKKGRARSTVVEPEIQILDRVGPPSYGRAGRAIKPRGKQRYYFPRLHAQPQNLRLAARVRTASFFEGKVESKPPVKIARRKVEKFIDTVTQAKVERSVFPIRNNSPHTVDLLLLATPSKRSRPGVLCLERLAPGESRLVGQDPMSAAFFGRPSTYPVLEGDFAKVKVVDWSVVADRGEERARSLFASAWKSWYRWPEPFPRLAGRLRFHGSSQQPGGEIPETKVAAAFVMDADGKVSVDPEQEMTEAAERLLVGAVRDAFADLRRPSFEELMRNRSLAIHGLGKATRVLLEAKDDVQAWVEFPYFDIVDGRFVSGRDRGSGSFKQTTLKHCPAGNNAHLIAEIEVTQSINDDRRVVETRRWTWKSDGPLVLPTGFARRETAAFFGGAVTLAEIEFESIELGGRSVEATMKREPGVEPLRLAWESVYRYPEKPVTLGGNFAVDLPRRPLEWQGLEKVRGRFRFEGYTGLGRAGSGLVYERGRNEVDGDYAVEVKRNLSSLLNHRFTIWTRLDFCGRPGFDDRFRGASITAVAGEKGIFEVKGSDIASVEVKLDRIHEIRYRSGELRRFRFAKVKGEVVPVETINEGKNRRSRFIVDFDRIRGGRMFPVRVEMHGWFGPDWGPETYRFSGFRVE